MMNNADTNTNNTKQEMDCQCCHSDEHLANDDGHTHAAMNEGCCSPDSTGCKQGCCGDKQGCCGEKGCCDEQGNECCKDDKKCCGDKGCCDDKGCCSDGKHSNDVPEDCCQVTGGPCRCKGETEDDDEAPLTKEQEYLAGWQRTLADFENYKKRQAHERTAFQEHAAGEIIQTILPVLDNFQQAYGTMPDDIKDHSWVKGIGFIKQQLEQVLEEFGIQRIATEGKPFDEMLHEAVQDQQSKSNTGKDEKKKVKRKKKGAAPMITKEVRAGYTMNDKVLRPSRVIVEHHA